MRINGRWGVVISLLSVVAATTLVGAASPASAKSGWCHPISTNGMTRQEAVRTLKARGCHNIIVHIRCNGNPANFGKVFIQRPAASVQRVPSGTRIELWVGLRMNGPTGQPTSTRCPDNLNAPTVTNDPTLADLNGDYQGTYTPTWEFDDVTVKDVPIPISFHIEDGKLTSSSGATGDVTWQGNTGNVRVDFPISTASYQASCDGNWQFTVDGQHHATMEPGGLECRGGNVYNTGTVTANKV